MARAMCKQGRASLQPRCSLPTPPPHGLRRFPREQRAMGSAQSPLQRPSFPTSITHVLRDLPQPPRHSVVLSAKGGSGGGGSSGGGGGAGGGGGGDGHGNNMYGSGVNFQAVMAAVLEAKSAWDKYDTDKSGKLSLNEAVVLLQSKEMLAAAKNITKLDLPPMAKKDIETLFKAADRDKSGDLSQVEFLALFLASATHTIKANPMVLAEALVTGVIDKDRNGRIDGHEFKSVLSIVGVPGVLLLPIPDNISVEYKGILSTIGAALGHK